MSFLSHCRSYKVPCTRLFYSTLPPKVTEPTLKLSSNVTIPVPAPTSMPLVDGPHFRKSYNFKDARWTRSLDVKPTLPPFIGEKPLSFMFRIQQGLIDKVNAMVSGTPLADYSLFDLVRITQGDMQQSALHQYASQAWNMAFFFSTLTPSTTMDPLAKEIIEPSAVLAGKLTDHFGSVDKFKEQFNVVVKAFFGSGWVWLVETNQNHLQIVTTMNGSSPLRFPKMEHGTTPSRPSQWPLLGLSQWENAYILTHASTATYALRFWDALNWSQVDQYLSKAPTQS